MLDVIGWLIGVALIGGLVLVMIVMVLLPFIEALYRSYFGDY